MNKGAAHRAESTQRMNEPTPNAAGRRRHTDRRHARESLSAQGRAVQQAPLPLALSPLDHEVTARLQ